MPSDQREGAAAAAAVENVQLLSKSSLSWRLKADEVSGSLSTLKDISLSAVDKVTTFMSKKKIKNQHILQEISILSLLYAIFFFSCCSHTIYLAALWVDG